MTVRDYLWEHGFIIGLTIWFFYLSARLGFEQNDLKAYKKGVTLVSWLLYAIVTTLYFKLR